MEVKISELINQGSISANDGNAVLKVEQGVQSTYEVTASHKAVSFEFDQDLVVEAVRVGQDMVLQLASGETIRLVNYFEHFAFDKALYFTGVETAVAGLSGAAAAGGAGLGLAAIGAAGGGSGSEDTAVSAPETPTVDSILSNDASPVLVGTAAANASVEVTLGDATFEVTADEDGNWTLDTATAIPVDGVFTPLADGTYDVELTATDELGNVVSDVTTGELEVDTMIDALTVEPTDGTELSGIGEPGATVTVTYPGLVTPLTAVVTEGGTWSIAPTEIPHGTVLSVTQVDPAGNMNGPTNATVDAQTDVPTIDAQETNDPTPVLTGTAEGGATVEVTLGGATFEVTANEDGVWTLNTETAEPTAGTFTLLTDGLADVEVTATDALGNTASDATTDELDVDVTPPSVTIASLVTGLNTLVSGTGEPNGTVSIFDAEDNLIGTAPTDDDGNWTFEPTTPLEEGAEISAQQSDELGNVGTAEANLALDTDGDGVANTVDIDDDNDGILDTNEAGHPVTLDLSGLHGSFIEFGPGPIIEEFETQAGGVTQPLADIDLGDRTVSLEATYQRDVTQNLTGTPESSADQGGDAIGNLNLQGFVTDVVDPDNPNPEPNSSMGDHVEFNLGEPLVIQFTHETNGVAEFDPVVGGNGDEIRLEALGGFSVHDPDGQLEIVSNEDGILIFREAGTSDLPAGDATWTLTTNEPVSTFGVRGDSDATNGLTSINIAVIDIDFDNDGIIDSLDTDSDNGGISDNAEAQLNQTYVAPLFDEDGNPVDEDGDGLNDAYDEDLTGAANSVGLTPADTDDDETPDVYQGEPGEDTPPVSVNPLVTGLETTISGLGVPGSVIELTDVEGNPIALVDENGDPLDPSEVVVDENGAWSAIPATPLEAGAEVTATQTLPEGHPLEGTTSTATEVTALDTDADGVANTIDIDDDGDGILDVNDNSVSLGEFGAPTLDAGAPSGFPHLFFDHNNFTGNPTFDQAFPFPGGLELNNIEADVVTDPGSVISYGPGLEATTGEGGSHLATDVPPENMSFATAQDAIDAGAYVEMNFTTTDNPDRVLALEGFEPRNGAFRGNAAIVLDGEIIGEIEITANGVNYTIPDGPFPLGNDTEHTVLFVPYNYTGTDPNPAFMFDSFGWNFERADYETTDHSLDTDSDDGGIGDNIEAQYDQTYVAPTGFDDDGDGLDNAYDENPDGAENSVGLTPADTDADGIPDVYQGEPDEDTPPLTINPLMTGLDTTIAGIGVPGSTIALTNDEGDPIALVDENGDPIDPAVVTVDENGEWSATPATPLEEGAEVTATQSFPEDHPLDGTTSTATQSIALDTDADGVANAVDIDDDNDGILDVNEALVGELGEFTALTSDYSIRFSDDASGLPGGMTENNVSDHVVSGAAVRFGPDFDVQISDRPDQYGDAYQFDLGAVANTTPEDALAAGHYIDIAFTTAEDDAGELALSSIGTDLIGGFYGDFAVYVNGEYVGVYDSVGHTSQALTLDEPVQLLNGQENTVRYVMFNDTSSLNYVHGFELGISRAEYEVLDDADNDGIINALETDSDDGGVNDNIEAQYNQAYVAPSGEDVDGDGLDDAYDDDLNGAENSVGLIPADTDSNGIPDVYQGEADEDTPPVFINPLVAGFETIISGIGVPGSTIALTDADDNPIALVDENGDPLDPAVVTVDENGEWSAIPATPLEEGAEVTATQTLPEGHPLEGTPSSVTQTTALDTDADDVANTVDIDDDNDGILDVNELSTFEANSSDPVAINGNDTAGVSGDFDGVAQLVSEDGLHFADVNVSHTGNRFIAHEGNGGFIIEPLANGAQTVTVSVTGPEDGPTVETAVVTFSLASAEAGVYNFSTPVDVDSFTVLPHPGGLSSAATISADGMTMTITGAQTIVNFKFEETSGGEVITMTKEPGNAGTGHPGNNSYGLAISVEAVVDDIDGDGIINALDTDSDNGGASDNEEAQYNQTYIAPSGEDVDGDGLDDAYDENLDGAEDSVGLTPADTDGNGTADAYEADGDGIDSLPLEITNATTSIIEGTGVPGSEVVLDINGTDYGPIKVGTDGLWEFSVEPPAPQITEVKFAGSGEGDGEFVELYVPTNTDLTSYALSFYEVDGTLVDNTFSSFFPNISEFTLQDVMDQIVAETGEMTGSVPTSVTGGLPLSIDVADDGSYVFTIPAEGGFQSNDTAAGAVALTLLDAPNDLSSGTVLQAYDYGFDDNRVDPVTATASEGAAAGTGFEVITQPVDTNQSIQLTQLGISVPGPITQGEVDLESFAGTVTGVATLGDQTSEEVGPIDILLDSDGDGVADVVDIDDDNDGILDVNESASLFVAEFEGTFGSLSDGNSRDLQDQNGVDGYTFRANNNSAGQYAVVNSAGADNFHGATLFDHLVDNTTGDAEGAFLVINGGTTQGVFFSEEITLTANTEYDFGFHAANAILQSGAATYPFEIGMRVLNSEGEVVAEISDGPQTSSDWVDHSNILNTGEETNFTIEVFNISTNASGNDFAIDDIYVRVSGGVETNDVDNDGIINAMDTDSDNGGIDDNVEVQYNQTYIAPSGVDTDRDGLDDAYDDNLDGAENSVGLTPADTDGDGTPDVYQGEPEMDEVPFSTDDLVTGLDTTISGFGVPGSTVVLTDAEGEPIALVDENGDPLDPSEVTVDENGEWSAIPAMPLEEGAEITATQTVHDGHPLEGTVSTATETVALDTDADGVANSIDIDDDNDGILDVDEPGVPSLPLEGPGDISVVGNHNFQNSGAAGIDATEGNATLNLAPTYDPDMLGQTVAYKALQEIVGPGTYTLSVDVGNFANGFFPDLEAGLTVGGTDAGSPGARVGTTISEATIAPGETDTWTFELVVEEGSPLIGQQLGFEITATRLVNEAGAEIQASNQTPNASLDNFQLSAPFDPNVDTNPDTDGDGIIDSLDADSDGGGVGDNVEAQYGQDFIEASGFDANGDGLDDAYDLTESGGRLGLDANATGTNHVLITEADGQDDHDADGISSSFDTDDDGDGILDTIEDFAPIALAADTAFSAGQATGTIGDIGVTVTGSGGGTVSNANGVSFSYNESLEGTITSEFDGAFADLTFEVSSLYAGNSIGNFTMTLDNGTVLSNLDFVVADPVNLSGGGTANTAARSVNSDGIITLIDPDGGDGNDQAGGHVTFVGLDYEMIAEAGGIRSLSFDIIDSPINANTSFTIGGSPLTISYPDADGDGVNNSLDVDSDGDGIWDGDEAATNKSQTVDLGSDASALAFGLHQNNPSEYTDASLTYAEQIALKYSLNLNAHSNQAVVPELDQDYFSPDLIGGDLGAGLQDKNLSGTAFMLDTVDDAHLDPFADDHYVQLAFEMQETFPAGTDALAMNSIRVNNVTSHTTGVTIRMSNDGFETYTEVLTDTGMISSTEILFDNAMVLEAGETYEMRLYYHGEWSAASNVYHDDVAFGVQPFDPSDPANVVTDHALHSDQDTDDDGVFDRHEVDSDGDGSTDREEVELDAADLAALESGTANSDGYLILADTAGLTLDFGNVENVTDLEYINMEGGTAQTLTLSDLNVLSATDSGSLVILGDDTDTVNASGFTDTGTTQSVDGKTLNVFEAGSAQILVEEDVDVVI